MGMKEYTNMSQYSEILHMTKFELAFCISYFISALIICVYSTPMGSLFSPDSTAYVLDAENFLGKFPIYYSAPIYPALIAIGMFFGLTLEQSAGIVPIICYSLVGFPLYLIGKTISRPVAGYLACIICLLCGKYLLYLATYAWTDMPFIFFSICALLFLTIYNKYQTSNSIVFTEFFVILASFTRLLGISLIPIGIIVIALNNKNLKKFLSSVFIFCLMPTVLFIIWMIKANKTYYFFSGTTSPLNLAKLPIDLSILKFITLAKEITSLGDIQIIFILIPFCFLVIYIYFKKRLIDFIKKTASLTICIIIYSIVLIESTSSLSTSIQNVPLEIRYVIPIYPYLVLMVILLFLYVYDEIDDRKYKFAFKAILIILLICLVAQGANSLYIEANDIRTQSIVNYSDREGLSRYISEYNVTPNDIYIDRKSVFSNLQMELFSHQTRHQIKIITNSIPGETILDNLSASSYSGQATSLADLIKKNRDRPIYIIVSYKVSQIYSRNSSKYICLSNPYKFSESIIYKVELKENESDFSDSSIITNSNSISNSIITHLVGNFKGSKNSQLLLLSHNSKSTKNQDVQILDFVKGFPDEIKYKKPSQETRYLANLPDFNSTILAGDFMDLGYSQALFINRNLKGDKIIIEDFSQEKPLAITRYSEVLRNDSYLKNLFNPNNLQLTGDFLDIGYIQVLSMDRNSKDGKLEIVDFKKGKPHAFMEISEIEDDLRIPIASLLDHGDLQFAGDFMGLGYSQILFINLNHSKAENAKIVIADFSKTPPSVKYLEKWGESSIFSGWLDANDTQLVGDFMGIGHSQVLFVSDPHKGGKIMIADFSPDKPFATIKFSERWVKGVFEGWLDINDTRVAGDFAGLGYDQILFINSSLNGIRTKIVDFKYGMPIQL